MELPTIKQTNLLINNQFVPSKSGGSFDTFNPATEEKIATVAEADTADVDDAVAAAREAFDNGPWRKMAACKRGDLLRKLADLVEKHAEELAALEALDGGKPCSMAKAVDVYLALKTFRYYSGWADKIHGQTIPIEGPFFC